MMTYSMFVSTDRAKQSLKIKLITTIQSYAHMIPKQNITKSSNVAPLTKTVHLAQI